MLITEHTIQVPLDHDHETPDRIEIFAREIAAPDGRDRPYLVYLQGGPGFEAPRPTARPMAPAWLDRALADFRVLMLDQRGTGRSTPYGAPGLDPAADADRLTHFRADAIVRDAECLREHLGAERWSLLGQSFGGFTSLHYLSAAPQSLREVFFTGGLPPVGRHPDEIYAATFDQMRRLNRAYHRRYPQDAERLRALLERCDAGEVRTPDDEPVTRRRLRTIGNQFGMDDGAENVHHLLELDPLSPAFRHDVAGLFPFGPRNPLYALVHESSYSDGFATRWSAERVQPDDFAGDSTLLTGEHLFPWHFDDTPGLRPYRDIAQRLAEHEWPRLYDADVLADVDVPCAAVIYGEDPFVDRRFSEEVADLIPTMRPWLTNEYLHNGLRTDGGRVLDHLIGLTRR